MLAILFAFIVISNYQFKNINPITTDVFVLELTIYFIVFIQSFYLQVKVFFQKEETIRKLENDQNRNKLSFISVTANRKQHKINLDELLYIESLSDYVKIHTLNNPIITKQKISELETSISYGDEEKKLTKIFFMPITREDNEHHINCCAVEIEEGYDFGYIQDIKKSHPCISIPQYQKDTNQYTNKRNQFLSFVFLFKDQSANNYRYNNLTSFYCR